MALARGSCTLMSPPEWSQIPMFSNKLSPAPIIIPNSEKALKQRISERQSRYCQWVSNEGRWTAFQVTKSTVVHALQGLKLAQRYSLAWVWKTYGFNKYSCAGCQASPELCPCPGLKGPSSLASQNLFPTTWYLIGSLDALNWYPIDYGFGVNDRSSKTNMTKNFTPDARLMVQIHLCL